MADRDRPQKSDAELSRDNWPVEGDPNEWTIERDRPDDATAEDLTAAGRDADTDAEWLGFTGEPSGSGAPYLYLPQDQSIYRGQLDPENERVLLSEDDRYEIESDASLGDHLETLGEEHGWSWLSSFAREYLGADETSDDAGATPASAGETPTTTDESASTDGSRQFELRETEFMQGNVTDEADHDLAFSGSHTFVDESGQVYVLGRDFEVTVDDDAVGTDRATVTVDEQVRVAEEPEEDRRAGDAERIDRRRDEIEIEFDADAPDPEGVLADELERWHESNVEWSGPR